MKILKSLLTIAFISLGTVAILKPDRAIAAEKIGFSVPFLGKFHVMVEDLEIFAESGEITPSFAFYTKFLDQESLDKFRQVLQTSISDDPVEVYRITNNSMGKDALRRLGKVVYTHPERNGLYPIRSALISAAAEPDGLTPINFLRHFPTEEIQLNTQIILAIAKEARNLFEYKYTTVTAIAKQSEQEIALSQESAPDSNFGELLDLTQPGQYKVRRREMSFSTDSPSQTSRDFNRDYNLLVNIYLPTESKKLAPLVVIAHGFGAKGSDYDEIAIHLASYGYIVAIPEHGGRDNNYQKALLRGEKGEDINRIEFYSRPQEISHVLDRLETHPDFRDNINWSQVGVLGHSLGGTTAFLVSGAALNWDRIQNICQQDNFVLNVSVFLQCRAKNLPPGEYNFRDSRIKAVVALNSIGSLVLGPESMGNIEIPTLIAGGTNDFIAPFIEEQVHPFLWLNTAHKYLATVVGGNHVTNSDQNNFSGVSDVSEGAKFTADQNYFKALSLAFFETHVRNIPEYESYLTAGYVKTISQPQLPIHLIHSLTSAQLELAYGDKPPIPPVPAPVVATIRPNPNTQISVNNNTAYNFEGD